MLVSMRTSLHFFVLSIVLACAYVVSEVRHCTRVNSHTKFFNRVNARTMCGSV